MVLDVLETGVLSNQHSCTELANEETDTTSIKILFGIPRRLDVSENLIVCQTF